MRKMVTLAIVAFLSLGLLAGCGGGKASEALKVEMGEGGAYSFSPDNLTVSKGGTVKVTVINKDPAQPHSFLIKEFNVNSGQVGPNQTKELTFKADKTGEFEFICDVPGHLEGGMVGKLTVTE